MGESIIPARGRGSRYCRAVVPPNTDACGASASHVVTFRDGDRAVMCADCMAYYRAFAEAHGAPVSVERIESRS
jgi:hypothetical protein